MKEFKPYLVKFDENDKIKNKIYLPNCIVSGEDCQPIIIITYYKYIFFANNNIYKTWPRIRDIFLHLKS